MTDNTGSPNMMRLLLSLFLVLACQPLDETDQLDFENRDVMTIDNRTSQGGWSTSGFITSQDGENSAVKLQAIFPKADNYSVQFSVGTGNGNLINPTAEIVWSLEGNSVRRLVSVINGLTVTGMAQGASVRVYDAVPTNMGPMGPQVTYPVGVQIAPGVRAAENQPPTLVISQAPEVPGANSMLFGQSILAAGTNIDVQLPIGAGIISAYCTVSGFGVPTVITEADIQVLHYNSGGFTLKSYDPRLLGFVPLGPDTTTIRIANFSAAGIYLVSLTFGIDG